MAFVPFKGGGGLVAFNSECVMRTFIRSALSALLLSLTVLPFNDAKAQSLGLWGGWNDYGHGWQGEPSRQYAPRSARGEPDFGFGSGAAFPRLMDGGPRPFISPKEPNRVALPNAEAPGTILIDTRARRLYYTLDTSTAFEYPISVGRDGFTWTGTESISRIAEWPDWHPPKEMLERDPRLPEKMTGGIKNPLGAVALYLGDTLYRIHGTNDPKTIGVAASSGCFRMLNAHAVHLASLAGVGTTVKVMPSLPEPATVADLPWEAEAAGLGMRESAAADAADAN